MPSGLSQYEVGNVGPGGTVLQGEHLSIGFTAAEVQQFVQAERAGVVQQYTSQLIELAKQLGTTQEAVRSMLHIAGHDDIPADRVSDTLIAIATQYRTLRQALTPQALTRSADDGGEIAELRRQAVSALDAGAFDDATRLLNDIRARKQAVSEQRRRRAEEARADWIAGLQSEAETCALLGRAALGQRDVARAVAQFEEGLQVLAPVDPAMRWSYARDAAAALYDFGDRAGHNDALAAAIVIYRRALADAPRERVRLDWAMTQNNLGLALWTLGERESGTARLEEAVAAYRAALEERTQERVPLDWATTQNNLTRCLALLDERRKT
jgi:tetratricopeptide (TPR) repeat protein